MKYESQALAIPASATTGTPLVGVGRYMQKTVSLSGTFVGTFQLQGKMPGGGYINIGTALTAPGFVTVTDANGAELCVDSLRWNCTAFTSNASGVSFFAGHDTRSE